MTQSEAVTRCANPEATLLAARAWLKAAKARGDVEVLGGGWWKIRGLGRPVQGFHALALRLRRIGLI